MDTLLALTIIGSIMITVGLIFIAIPKAVNQKIMGNLPQDAINISASFRVILGGVSMAIGFISLYSRNLPTEYAKILLFALGLGFLIINSQIVLSKVRGFAKELPIPPIILFFLLAIIAFYSS